MVMCGVSKATMTRAPERKSPQLDTGGAALAHISSVMALVDHDLIELLRVDAQVLQRWREDGVPAERFADVERPLSAATWMADELEPARIPAIVRAPVPALDGRSMLEFAREAGPLALLQHLAELFAEP